MTEAEWLANTNLRAALEWLGAVAQERRMLLFCVACCRAAHLDEDEQRRPILDATERYADALCSIDEVSATLNYLSDGCPVLETGRFIVNQADGLDLSVPESVNNIADLANWLVPSRREQFYWLHDIFENPFRPIPFAPAWRTDTATAIARQMYESRDFSAMPILADALQDAGCDSDDILTHCRDPQQVHVRGCWAVDLVLGKS